MECPTTPPDATVLTKEAPGMAQSKGKLPRKKKHKSWRRLLREACRTKKTPEQDRKELAERLLSGKCNTSSSKLRERL